MNIFRIIFFGLFALSIDTLHRFCHLGLALRDCLREKKVRITCYQRFSIHNTDICPRELSKSKYRSFLTRALLLRPLNIFRMFVVNCYL